MLNFLKVGVSLMAIFIMNACISTQEVQSLKPFPYLHTTDKKNMVITVYAFKNYTETPQAGQRAASLVEGLLNAKGYTTINRIEEIQRSEKEQRLRSQSGKGQYILLGSVSEWRYKTGIDGEPAISLQMKLIDTQNSRVIWSAVGSDNNWGNASIGTTAQGLFEKLLY